MKVGIIVPGMHSMELNEGMLKMAEAAGMDSVWLADHLLGVMHPTLWPEIDAAALISDPDAWLDPFCVAAVLGRQTKLGIGTCVTDSVRRRGPDLARTLMTLNASCGGGFILGLGSGENESTLPFGYDFSRPIGKLEDAARSIRSLLDHGRMPDGGVGRTGLVAQAPHSRAQLWIAGIGDRSMEIVGRYGDGWICHGVSPDEYLMKREQVRKAAQAAGRPMPTIALFPLMLLGDSREHVAAALERKPLTKLLTMFGPATMWKRHGLDHPSGPECRGHPDTIPHAVDPERLRQVAPRIPLALVEDYMMIGNAEDIARRMRPYVEGGVEHLILGDFTGLTFAPEETGRLITTQLGRLRQLLAAM